MGRLRIKVGGEWVDIPTIGPPGPTGPAGPTGPPGEDGSAGSGSAFYTHNQSSPAATWVVTHNMGVFPAVSVVDSAGEQVEGTVVYTNTNVVTLTFSAAFSGKAYLS